MSQNKKTILFVARDDGGCGFFRCNQPSNFLNRSGLAISKVVLNDPSPEDLLSADLVVMQEMGSMNAAKASSFMRAHNIPYITEVDDFIFHVSPRNTAGYGAWNPATLYPFRATEVIRKGVGMTVSTKALAQELFPYSELIYVIPNYLDKDIWENPNVQKNDDKIRIGWCGGNAHADDLKMISKVLEKLVKEYAGKLLVETIGMTRKELVGVFPLKVQNDMCEKCGYEGELHHYPGESLKDYPVVLASKGWDIAVAPVIDNAFGNCKSDIKIKEYAAVGYATVASRVKPYIDAEASGAPIILATTFEEWYEALKKLIDDKAERLERSRKGKEWIQKYWIQDNIPKTFDAYAQIIFLSEKVLGTKEQRLKAMKKLQ